MRVYNFLMATNQTAHDLNTDSLALLVESDDTLTAQIVAALDAAFDAGKTITTPRYGDMYELASGDDEVVLTVGNGRVFAHDWNNDGVSITDLVNAALAA